MPFILFFFESLRADSSHPVHACASMIGCDLPLCCNPARLFHAVQGGIQRSFLDAQRIIGDRLDARGNAIAMLRLTPQRGQNQQIECALQDIWLFAASADHLDG